MKRTRLVTKPRRKFGPRVLAAIIERQHGICACGCGEPLGDDPRAFEFDHEIELAIGGADTEDNLRAVLKRHHLAKTKERAAVIAKTRRIIAKNGHRGRNLSAANRELQKMLEAKN